MARRKTEPVKHTCPDINHMINTISRIVKDMSNYNEGDEKLDILSQIQDWQSDLKNIGVGRFCDLEDLRNSNSALREWGNEMYNEAESLEEERDILERQLEETKERVRELEDTVTQLTEELEELNK